MSSFFYNDHNLEILEISFFIREQPAVQIHDLSFTFFQIPTGSLPLWPDDSRQLMPVLSNKSIKR